MEKFGKKVRDYLLIGAAALAMTKPVEKLLDDRRAKQKEISNKNNESIVPVREVYDTVYHRVSLYEDPETGQLVNPKEQSVSEPQKAWLLNQMKSQEYQKKALAEGLTQKEINERIRVLDNTPIFYTKTKKVDESGADGMTTYDVYPGHVGTILIGKEDFESGGTATVHEAEHAATNSDLGISDYAKALYDSSYQKSGHSEKYEKYLQETTERDARKKQFEYELEREGIKKYRDSYTEETHKKVMDLYRHGKFTYGARQFIETTKPEMIIQIMNEIAENQIPENLPIENQG